MDDDEVAPGDALGGLLGSLADGAVAVDDGGTVVAVNDAALDALAPDREPADVHGSPAAELFDGSVPEAGEPVELPGPDGERTFEARASSVDGVEGVAGMDEVASLVVLRDVSTYTDRVERVLVLERILRHALRDEMTGVLGRAQYVRDAITEAAVLSEAQSAADAVVEATRDLAALGDTAWAVEDVFAAGGPDAVELDLVAVVEDVLADAREEYPGVKVDADLPASAPVVAPGTVERAIEAVVECACERNDAPVPRLDLTIAREPTSVTLEFADNSSGIDDDATAMLETGDEPPLGQDGGVDRWLAHWVVDAAGGTIDVTENVPRGTRVTVALPAAET